MFPSHDRAATTTTFTTSTIRSTVDLSSYSFLQVYIVIPSTSLSSSIRGTFNAETSSNYGYKNISETGSILQSVSGSGNIEYHGLSTTSPRTISMFTGNLSGTRKIGRAEAVGSNSGANAPITEQTSFVWNNTSGGISSIEVFSSSGTLGIGTSMYIFGK